MNRKITEFIRTLLAYDLIILLKIVGLFKKIVFCQMIHLRIGHLSMNTEIFLRRLKSGKFFDKKALYICVSGSNPANRQLMNMFKRNTTIIENNQLYNIVTDKSFKNSGYYHYLLGDNLESYEINQLEPTISFTPEEEEIGKRELKKMGLGEDDWFICFHSRDSKYLEKELGEYDWNYHDFRDCSIFNYIKAAKYIVSLGGFAIRMGYHVEEELPDDTHPHIIDYATKYISDFMDIYLSAHCKFFLGNTAGLMQVPIIFNVPVAIANWIPYIENTQGERDLYINKKLYSNKLKKVLSYAEIFKNHYENFRKSKDYQKNELVPIENTEKEIYLLTKEINELIDGKYYYTEEDSELIKRYLSLVNQNGNFFGNPSKISVSFLKNNMSLLD